MLDRKLCVQRMPLTLISLLDRLAQDARAKVRPSIVRNGLFRLKDSWPLRLAAVEAGKWACGRPGCRFRFDARQLVLKDGVWDHRQELSIVA